MPLTASAISTASVAPRTSMSGASPPTSMARVCCARRLSGRTANAASSQPAHGRGADRERADDDHPAVQVVGVGDGRVVGGADGDRHRSLRAAGSRRCARGSARRRRWCRRSRRAARAATTSEFDVTCPSLRTVMMASWSLGDFGISSRPRGRNGIAKPAASSSRRSRRSLRSLVMPTHTIVPTMPTTIAAAMAVANATRVRSDGVRRKIRDRSSRASVLRASAHHCCRRTNPTPRTVCSSRGAPPASSLRRRYPMNTSTTLVSAAKS